MSTPASSLTPGINYPTLETIMDLSRSHVNDTFAAGAGLILTDQNPATLPFLASSIRELYRKLRLVGAPTLIRDNFLILNIPPINGANGLAVADPSLQVSITNAGYFDGSVLHEQFILPQDMYYPLAVQERQSGTNYPFVPMNQMVGGMRSVNQGETFNMWEWRTDGLYMPGATLNRDLWLRYYLQLPATFSSTSNFDTTQIPVLDCEEFLAFRMAYLFAHSLVGDAAASLNTEAQAAIMDLRNEYIRRAQGADVHRQEYTAPEGSDGGNGSGGWDGY